MNPDNEPRPVKPIKLMSVEEIRSQTRSTQVNTISVVYEVIADTIAFDYVKRRALKLSIGDLICVNGCGGLYEDMFQSEFFIDDSVYWVLNDAVIHHANPIGTTWQ